MCLQCLHIIKGNCNAARRLEPLEALMLRIEQNRAETAVPSVVLVGIRLKVYLNLAHALQIVHNRALSALNFIVEIILAAGGDAGGGKVSDCSVFVADEEGYHIVIFDLCHLL